MSKFKELLAAREAATRAQALSEVVEESPSLPAAASEPLTFAERVALKKAQAQPKVIESKEAPAQATAQTLAATVTESYWLRVVDGSFVASTSGKPTGFGWKAINLTQYNALVEANLTKDAPSPAPAPSNSIFNTTPVAKAVEEAKSTRGGSKEEILAKLALDYAKARFTEAEVEEELVRVHAILDDQPSLLRVIEESPVPLNAKQLLAVSYTLQKQSFVLTGAAGTGKTTAQAAVVDILDKEGVFGTHDFKYLGTAPSIAICAFTKVAVRNIQKAIRKNPRIAHYGSHCMTIHSLLEYEPVKEDRADPTTGLTREIRVFQPQRHAGNPLGITHLIVEEASMVGLDLWWKLFDALLEGVQIIFLGDINQLQPVFSKPILGYALVKLPVIELDRVYRQALDSPIIYNAHQVLVGNPIKTSKCGKVTVVEGKSQHKVGQSKMGLAMGQQFKMMYEAGFYSPDEDMILLPWNKQWLGTKAINEVVASFLGADRDALVYHVKSNRTQWYLAVDDKVLVDKRAGMIVGIEANSKYIGSDPRPPGFYTRDGTPILGGGTTVDFGATSDASTIDYSNFSMEDVETEEGQRAASHIVSVKWDDDDSVSELRTAGDFSDTNFQFGYAMTVHKAQGSEWRKVFCALHVDHMSFICRELMYTALTRAREEFVLFAKPDVIERACAKQDIKGNSLADKIEYFNSGALLDLDQVPVEKPFGWDED